MESKSNLPVSKFMINKLVFVNPDEPINEVARKMYESHVGSAFILKNSSLIGIVTNRDIASAVTVFKKLPNLPVRNIMSSPVLHVPPEESIIKVAEIMTSKNVRRLAIVDQDKVVGVISSSDLAILFSMCKEEDLGKIFGAYIN